LNSMMLSACSSSMPTIWRSFFAHLSRASLFSVS
jgi:hypothetical protein